MKKPSKGKINQFWSYLLFFLVIAVIITITIPIFAVVSQKSGDNKAMQAIVMLLVIIFLAALSTIFDAIRRKYMVEQPVEKILEATQKIASGDFSVKLTIDKPYRRQNQYDTIMENINIMTAELSRNEILKSDFISNVSHELKTPLTVIQNYCRFLKDENLDSETRQNYVDTLVQASKRLSSLVVNILKLNKLENQETTPEKEKVRLNRFVEETLLQSVDLIDAKGIELDVDLQEISAITSASYLEIALNNLLSNAIKFTPSGGKISVSLKNENGKAVLSIADTGCGIDPETGKHIFDKFYQGDTSHSQEGNGLGLALVKKVIDILGGEISVKSELGKGSTFILTLSGDANED
ncbi:MAG: HAMP domain-containing histidine kinase [Clostridia bacterium]|nr:HAMP domain-containing histidine kinase [Clostridia bacterium]